MTLYVIVFRNICANNDVGLNMIKSLTTKHLDLANSSAKINVRIAAQLQNFILNYVIIEGPANYNHGITPPLDIGGRGVVCDLENC